MSDILLVAVNSSFSHTNIAVRCLKYYADRFLCSTCTTQGDCDSDIPKGECDKTVVPAGNFDSGPVQGDLSGGAASPIQFCEFTINQPLGEIIRGINSQNPKIILFSTYIWNIETVVRIAKNIKVLRPEIVIGAGGPEAGFRGSDFLKENPDFDFVMKGEGEETFRLIVEREIASAAPVPQGDFVPGAKQCAALVPQGDLDNASGAQQCAAAPAGALDGVISAQHSAAAPAGVLGFVPGAQQCGASVPQGEFVLGAQQCGSSQGDSDLSHGATPAGDLGFVPGTQQCAIPQGNAPGAQQCAAAPAGVLGNALGAQQCAAAPQGDLDNASGVQQCGALVPQGDLGFVSGAQQCTAPQGDSDLSHGATPAGDLGFVPGAQQCAVPQGNASGAQQCDALVPQGDFVPGAQHSAAAPAGDLGFVPGAQQCDGSVPQGDFAPGAQQCAIPQGNALSAQQCAGSVPQGDLDNALTAQQCAVPQGNASGAQQCGAPLPQGDSDLSQGAAPAGDLGFVSGAQQCGASVPQGEFDSGDLDNALSSSQCAAAPAGDLDFVPGTQQCAIPQDNALSAKQCAAPVPQGEFVLGAQQCAATPQGDFAPGAQQCAIPQGNALSAQQCGASVPQGEKFLESLKNVKGLYLRNPSHKNDITFTGDQELICDMGTIPFPYPDLEKMDVDHKIFYYESSRGCPFSCAYCMSSLDRKVRFVPLEKVYADLQRFLDAGVKLVKFVDRTYNLKPERYVGIWKYIMEHHNGKTMFHFEIEGEFLSEEAMEFLQTVPEGIMQFEIGVQSSNPVVLKACGRSPETKTLRENILRIPKTIHTHLDLIAGLPYEDLESFGRSFDFVMSMEPDALQLGFLKVLYGAPVNSFCGSEPGWKWMKTPPYEILETPYLNYDEILFLKDLETALDAYWNDHHFDTVMRYLAWACYRSRHGDMDGTSQGDLDSQHCAAAPQGDLDNALTAQQCAAPQGNAPGTQQCGTPQGDSDFSHCAAAPQGALDNAPSAQHCGTSQGNASGAQHCAATLKGDSDLSHGAAWWKLFVSLTKWLRTQDAFSSAHQKDYWAQMLYEYLEWQEDVAHHGGFVLTAQQCAAAPASDFDSGDLDNALSSSQCNVARELLRFDYIAGGKKTNPPAWLRRNYDDQGHYDALQNTTGIKHSRLDFVYSDFDTFSVNPLDPATWHAAPAAPSGDLDNAMSAQHCHAVPQGDPDNVGRSQQGVTYSVLFLYARKESDRPTDFQRVPHQILIH